MVMEITSCGANWKRVARKELSGIKICSAEIMKAIFARIVNISEVLRIDLLFFLMKPRPKTSETSSRTIPDINSITVILNLSTR